MRGKLSLVAVVLFLHAGAVCALTVDEIVARNVQARGGLQNLHALKSLRLTGKLEFDRGGSPRQSEFGLLKTRPGRLRQEVTLQGLTSVDAYDGTEGWSLQPFRGRRDAQRVSADEAKELARNADVEGPLVDWKEKGHRVEYLGTEDVEGTLAHKLRVARKDGDIQYFYLDGDAFLEIRVVTQSRIRGVDQVNETDLGSYGLVAGVWIPFSYESGRKGEPKGAHFTVQHAEANVEVDDALFRFPASGTKVIRSVLPSPQAPAPNFAQPPPSAGKPRALTLDSGMVSGLGARNIGSATMSGRISAVAGRNEGGKTTLYVGAASGGVWKSSDGGTTFKPVFDKQSVQSIGAIAIAPSDPKTIWVGTGEAWTRNSVSIGNGIYKSTDGGETWTMMGLPQSERIARITIHPQNPSIVYACVPGKLWSDSADRGLYKTTDGGKTWGLVLKGPNLSTGCSTLAMDPKNPDLLLAGLWDFRRKGWTFRSGGEGPNAKSGSGLFRSSDGGNSWVEVAAAQKGLPAKPWGRLEVVIAPSDGKIVYAFIESQKSALYRSSDGGATWEARDNSQNMVWRPFYFGRMVVDPLNPDRLFKVNLQLIVSDDGGRSFSNSNGQAHGDWHDLWIDPQNTKHIVGGDDGGLWTSVDGGSRWWKSGNLPVSQFYHVSVDAKDPYHVYGGLQDNSTWIGDSQYGGGISNARWENLYGGDGFWALVDPTDPDGIYVEAQGGFAGRVDHKTQTGRAIQPLAAYKERLRYNWNTPIHVSPTQKGTLYIGAQFLFRSRDRGQTWERISPDLSTNDPEKQKQEESGGITVDNSSAEMHTTVYSISESPLDSKVIWVGTDDGNIQLTRDGGKSWTNLARNIKDLPPGSWVSWVEAGHFAPGAAYAAIDRHTFGDMAPWVYRTADFGKTWSRIAGPEKGVRGYAHVIKEDAVKRELLFCGTELGLWISVDAGKSWAEFKGGDFPSVAVRDLAIHPRDHDLVIATHGRGIWIVDDISPLRSLSSDALAREVAFLPGRPVQQRMESRGGWSEGDATFLGQNPPSGATISYYQSARHLYGPIEIEVLDDQGKTVTTLPASRRRGVNRTIWSMFTKAPRVPPAVQVAFSASRGPRVLPGIYTVRLAKGATKIETKLEVRLDSRAPYNEADRKAQFEVAMRASQLFNDMSTLVERIDQSRKAAEARAKELPAQDELGNKVRALVASLEKMRNEIVATKEGGAITGEERIREHTDIVYGALTGWEGRPARYQVERVDALRRELEAVKSEFEGLLVQQVRRLDDELRSRKLQPI